MNTKKILLTGITGQDGSYMAEYLLGLSHQVYGMARRTAQIHDQNFRHLLNNPNLKIVRGDLQDGVSLNKLVQEIKPDYFINFAAQSFVGDSWKIPEETFLASAVGVLRCLEAIRNYCPACRFYNAGSSEQFGDVITSPQDETHPFRPRSPYGAAKAAAHFLVKVYRESYNLYAVQGICYNHECLTANTPVILLNRNSHLIDIKPISEIVPHRSNPKSGKKYTTIIPCEWLVWDGGKWSEIKTRTATWNDADNDKKVIRVQCRGGYYEATEEHKSFKDGGVETPTRALVIDDKLEIRPYPKLTLTSVMSIEEAEFLGYMTAEGYINDNSGRFTNTDKNLCDRVASLWKRLSIGYISEYTSCSGYTGQPNILNVNLLGDSAFCLLLKKQLYTQDGYKKVPQKILNAPKDIMMAYLKAYNLGDGTKASKQKTDFQCFTTNSPTLAAGLWYMMDSLGFRVISCPEERGQTIYFKLNVNSNALNKGNMGKHLIKNIKEITKLSRINYEGWLFDLETDSHTFSAGVGKTWVHNSERRGEEFVTRKITKGFAQINQAILHRKPFAPIRLGNINAARDWSHAWDFMDAIWRMLNQDLFNPELIGCSPVELPQHLKEYVIASGETRTVKDFINIIVYLIGLKAHWVGQGTNEQLILDVETVERTKAKSSILITIDEEFYRPADVHLLLGSANAIKKDLGWKPEISFDELAKRMLTYDMYGREGEKTS